MNAGAHSLVFVPPPGSEETVPSALDRHFARAMVELHIAQESTATPCANLVVRASSLPYPSTLEWAAQLASAWRGAGHTCVPLADICSSTVVKELRASPIVGTAGEFCPLILDAADRLYLHRYWAYERAVGESIVARTRNPPTFDARLLAQGLARFFPEHNEQREAAARTVQSSFSVITGGPGTGKTRTVVILLALLIEQFAAEGRTPRIALTAPTGKASARLKESIRTTGEQLQLPESIRDALPAEATTLHRLLGVTPHSPYFRHDADHPLAVDAVIVDEASMVDLALMAKLFDAVPATARLILLGDKDQLASVEAGYVLGDICRAERSHGSALSGHITELRTNYRFNASSGIHALSTAVNSGRSEAVEERLFAGAADVSSALLPAPSALGAALLKQVLEGYRPYLDAASDPAAALARLQDFRILAALRRGPFGVENLNHLTEGILRDAGLIEPVSIFYHGRPILILQNDPQSGLFNGDVGLILRDIDGGNELRAFFLDLEGALRRLLPSRLPTHETGFAMTVHKSQGSEFARVLLVLPDQDHPVVTRALVYTGLTRAREHVELWYRESALQSAIERKTIRTSGLNVTLKDLAAAGARPTG